MKSEGTIKTLNIGTPRPATVVVLKGLLHLFFPFSKNIPNLQVLMRETNRRKPHENIHAQTLIIDI